MENETKSVTPEEAMKMAVESEEIGSAAFSIRKNGLILVSDCTIPAIYAPNLIAALRDRANYLELALAQGEGAQDA